ncbi:MAG: cell surface protein SprA [Candidatus Zixiibacteriota bacterium]|nr:MAG: cell surface protein SprA [candidate division Zixibacteria bacterium]
MTFSAAFYKKALYVYEYVPRTVSGPGYFQYRKERVLEEKLRDARIRSLSKDQRDKRGGLLAINIPIKSKAVESLFGEGGAGLKVSGYHQISFSGRSQWDDRASTATYRQNKFPTLNMEQISRFEINGTIGTKVTVSVTQDSKTDIPLANRLIIRYKGDEDDIVKSIEAGNTTLSLPNTQFVGYSTRIQGLFGVKTEAQIGSLKLTAIASQEKGSTERTTINAGASGSKDEIRDWAYYDGKIYDLGRQSDFNEGDTIKAVEVYMYVETNTGVGIGDTAVMLVDPDNPEFAPDEASISIVKVVEDDYFLDPIQHYIMFETPNAGLYTGELGVWMIIKRVGGTLDTVGNITSSPDTLKLIKHRTPDSTMVTWNYMWRNVYSLKGRDIDPEGLEIRIYKGENGTEDNPDNLDNQDGIPYIKILGLDQYQKSGPEGSDDIADVHRPEIVNTAEGLLIFPSREPFNATETYGAEGLSEKIPEIYSNPRGSVQAQNPSKYYMVISSRSRSAEIRLNKTNIIEGSERVMLNGRQLQRNADDGYKIDYDFGTVTILSPEYGANSDLSIDFEYTPFMLAQKKTLFGIRGEYEFSKDFNVGSTFLYKSDKATERKPKVGQETSKMVVWDADASLKLKPNFLTNLVDALPFFSTETASNLGISAEVAQSHPNPNVDGMAYLDDFEGTRDSYSMGIAQELWRLGSKPVGVDEFGDRGYMYWYNPYNRLSTEQIWDERYDPGSSQSASHTLWLVFDPGKIDRRSGEYGPGDAIVDSTGSWASIMRYLPGGAANQDRAQLLELRVNGERGILHIDLGDISEDINGNGASTPDTEDKAGGNINILDGGEDIGLDNKTDIEEREYYQEPNNPDPAGDNYVPYDPDTSAYYHKSNGSQGDSLNPGVSGRPTTEDINRNGVLDSKNKYFTYQIDLSDEFSPYLVENSRNDYGWRTFRIPVRDSTFIDSVGTPAWSRISFVRYWMESPDGDSCIMGIAAADLISSNWEDSLIPAEGIARDMDSLPRFHVAVINTQENQNYYSPPGVTGHRDKVENRTEPEQSLLLEFENLSTNSALVADTGIAERILFDTPNLMGYRKLEMFIHGPDELAGDTTIVFFFRVGQDYKNYYELRKVFTETDWELVSMDFNKITALKEYLEKARKENPDTNAIDSVIDGTEYRIFGKPNITRVKYLAFGVTSLDTTRAVSGNIWVDELRLTDVRRDVGTAARISFSGNLADLFTYGGGYSYQNSYFRRISGSIKGGDKNNLGSGSTTRSYNFQVGLQLQKFVPRSLGATLPLSIRYSRSTSVPRLRSNSDIILPDELRDKESTVSTTKAISGSESFNKSTKNPLFTILLNRFRTSFSYSRTESRSPSAPMSMGENYNVRPSYSFKFGKVPGIRLFFWTKPIPILNKASGSRLFLFPHSYDLSGDFTRSLRVTRNIADILTSSLTRTFNGKFSLQYKVLNNLNANYSMNTRRDLSDPRSVVWSFNPKKFKLGRETKYSQNFGASYDLPLFAFLTHKFNFSTSYSEAFNLSEDTRNVSLSKSYGVSGTFDLRKLVKPPSAKKKPTKRFRDTEEAVKTEDSKKSLMRKAVEGPFALIRFMTGWIDPVSYGFKESYRYSYLGLMERAQLKFRFGLSDHIGARIDTESRAAGRSNAVSKSTNYSFSSGTKVLGGLKLGVTFNRTIRQDIVKSVNPQKSVSTTFPDINFNIGQLSAPGFIGKFLDKFVNPAIKKFSPRTKYTRTTTEAINLATGLKTSEKSSVARNPLLSFTVNLVRGVQVNVRTSRTVSEDKTFNAATGDLTRISRSIQTSSNFSTKYSFSWPTGVKFPIFGRLKFSSTMSMALDVTMRKQKREEATGTGPMNTKSDRSDLMITPNVSYAFSSQIKGGLSARWNDTNDLQLKRKSHIRELRIWVEIRF